MGSRLGLERLMRRRGARDHVPQHFIASPLGFLLAQFV
jgi:hypothetical protein